VFGFFSKPQFDDPVLGRLTRVGSSWIAREIATSAGPLGVTVDGDRAAPSPAGLKVAKSLIQAPEGTIGQALAFVRESPRALEFIQGNGDLLVDGFSVRESGAYSVELALSEWPDAMITVTFKDGRPSEVLLGD
jgi:hypothetical protein